MYQVAVGAASLLVIWGSWEYVRDVYQRKAHPRIVSWAIWSISMSVAAAGAALKGQLPGAVLAASGAAGSWAILITGWNHGKRDVAELDVIGLAVGSIATILLALAIALSVPAAIAVAASVIADLAAFLPTFRNGWRGWEPLKPFIKYTAAAAVTLLISNYHVVAGIIYPIYEFLACSLAAILIFRSPFRDNWTRRRNA